MRTASKGDSSVSRLSTGFTPRKTTSEDDHVFSFREARVQEYLSSLSEAETSSSVSSTSSFQKIDVDDPLPSSSSSKAQPSSTKIFWVEPIRILSRYKFKNINTNFYLEGLRSLRYFAH